MIHTVSPFISDLDLLLVLVLEFIVSLESGLSTRGKDKVSSPWWVFSRVKVKLFWRMWKMPKQASLRKWSRKVFCQPKVVVAHVLYQQRAAQ